MSPLAIEKYKECRQSRPNNIPKLQVSESLGRLWRLKNIKNVGKADQIKFRNYKFRKASVAFGDLKI